MKSLTLALCVIAILGSAASTFFYFQIGNTKEELKAQVATTETRANDLQAKLAESTAQGEALQTRLLTIDNERAEAVSKATAAESRNTQFSRDISQLRNQVTAKEEAEQALNTEVGQLKRELAQARLAASAATPEEVEAYKTNIATLTARVAELESGRGTGTLASLPNTTGGTSSSVAAQAAPVAASSDLKAEVVSIGAQNAFVVLNVGSASGVQAGQRFAITRNGSTVADALVSSVQENFSIAQIATGSLRGGLNKGDSATIAQ